jgi:hypothetical protein
MLLQSFQHHHLLLLLLLLLLGPVTGAALVGC